MKQIQISGTGSAIADYLYTGVDFSAPSFVKYMSQRSGDGGLVPGKLVLTEDLEEFAGVDAHTVVSDIVGEREPDSFNIGGPAVAALITAAQLSANTNGTVRFYAANGSDDAGSKLRAILEKTPVDISEFRDEDSESPYTLVLSDPGYAGGSGERTFLNNIGSSWLMTPDRYDDRFFNADIVLFGGTALVPPIHASLTELLDTAKKRGAYTVVSTVYDFPNEKKNPDKPWPLGKNHTSYPLIDLLIVDREEALRLSGTSTVEDARRRLVGWGTSALVITNGVEPVSIYADGTLFESIDTTIPVSLTNQKLSPDERGDTTGCGDNFVGAVLYALALSMQSGSPPYDLIDASTWGIAAGDFACYCMGGTYLESTTGEKRARIEEIRSSYLIENRRTDA